VPLLEAQGTSYDPRFMFRLFVISAIGFSLIATSLVGATVPEPSAFPDPPILFEAVTPVHAEIVCVQSAPPDARTGLSNAEGGGAWSMQINNAGIVLSTQRPAPIYHVGNGNLLYTSKANTERQLLIDEEPVTSADHDRGGMALILTLQRSNGWSCGPG
jgi:hypothetical protein